MFVDVFSASAVLVLNMNCLGQVEESILMMCFAGQYFVFILAQLR